MRHTRLKLVVSEDSVTMTTDVTREEPEALSTVRPDTRRLRLVDADDGRRRMMRRERGRRSNAGRAQRDGRWICKPVDPGSSPGAGLTVV